MRVILLQKVEKVGERYEVVDVASGYARNFLFPRKFAKPATERNMKALRAKKKAWQEKKEKKKRDLEELAEEMRGFEVRVKKRVNEEGRLFGSVDEEEVKKVLKEAGFKLEEAEIKLEKKPEEPGEWKVRTLFPFGIESEIKLIVEEEKE